MTKKDAKKLKEFMRNQMSQAEVQRVQELRKSLLEERKEDKKND